MAAYLALVLPAVNRVYAAAAPSLAVAELAAVDALALDGRLTGIEAVEIAGVPYISFGTADDRPLDDAELDVVANLSFVFAVYEAGGAGDEVRLRPLPARRLDRWDSDLLTIQRYVGKTNEQLTKLLLNLAIAAGHGRHAFGGSKLRVLDPLCGRGTTLNQAVMYGFDAAGIEVDLRDVDAYISFFTRWLKDKRAKHHADRRRVGRRGGSVVRFEVTIAKGKDARARGETQEVVVVAEDTTRALDQFEKASFDALVTDLPYGVQHRSRAGGSARRRPGELLDEALPVWRALLRPGSGVAVAWNTRVLPRGAVREAFESAGLEVLDDPAWGSFAHRVDQSIIRDVMVARRPAGPERAKLA